MSVLDRESLLAYAIPDTRDDYDARDAILYAVGVGAGLSPEIDETSLLFERDLQVLPTMALVLGTPGFWPMAPAARLDWPTILHGDQQLMLHSPLDPEGSLIGATKVVALADKGEGKAALIRAVKELRTPGGTLVATATETWVVRGAGGFGGERALPGDPLPDPPARDPGWEVVLPTSRAQAAIYRLSGDRNPLHIDPEFAAQAGFEGPILHGLSSLGVAARALIHACCDGRADRLAEIGVRFTAPVFPGETIRTHIWRGDHRLHFRAEVSERGLVIMDNGVARLRD